MPKLILSLDNNVFAVVDKNSDELQKKLSSCVDKNSDGLQRLSSCVDKHLNMCGHRWVDLKSLFSLMRL